MNVLIVDDEKGLADLYTAWLADDHDVTTANSGEDALVSLGAEVDVVILDRRMPKLSGDAVLERIREDGLDVRVAMVSAVEPDFDVLGMGFDDYLVKPVSQEELKDLIARLSKRSAFSQTSQELAQLASKKALLQSQKAAEELEQNDAYQELEQRVEELRTEAGKTIDEFDEADFQTAFRDLEKNG